MDVDDLPDAEVLWTRFAVLAALDRAGGRHTWSLDGANHVLKYDGQDGVRLRMQRLSGGRSVLWGSTEETRPVGWRDIPGWATSDAVHDWLRAIGASVLAWHFHGEWDTATPEADLEPLVRPLLGVGLPAALLDGASGSDPDLDALRQALGSAAASARGSDQASDQASDQGSDRGSNTPSDTGPVSEESVREALAVLAGSRGETSSVQGVVRTVLVGEIRAQMRRTPDRDRALPRQPAMLVRWSRVADPRSGFAFAVRHERGQLLPEDGNSVLAEPHRRSLLALLAQLRAEEATDDGGAWLFARVGHDGLRIVYDRAFDSWPVWFRGPEEFSLHDLAEEMAHRSAGWRPAWARLIPA